MEAWFGGLTARGRVLLALAAAVVAVGALTAGLALGDDDGDGDRVATGSSSTSSSSTSSSTTSTSTSTSSTVGDTSTTVAPAPGATTATTRKPTSGPTTTRLPTTTRPPTTTPPTSPPAPSTCNTSSSGNAGQLAARFCADRASHGLPTMRRTGALDAVAQEWANKLAAEHNANGRFGIGHRTNADQQARVLGACSKCNGWAENIAFATSVDGVWDAWLGSPIHVGNIRDGHAGEFGIGVAASNDGYLFAVQNFGRYP